MSQVTGAMLRELRLWADVGLRAVSRRSSGNVRLSDGHLSRVERGLRPVTPAVLAAYERALGMRIDPDTISHVDEGRKQPDEADRRAFQATVATLAAGTPTGGLGGEGEQRLLQEARYVRVPQRVTAADVTHLEQAALTLRSLDLRFGGELTAQIGGLLLRWAVGQRVADMSEPVGRAWYAAFGRLATWAAWSAYDACQPRVARALSVLGLDAAVRADEPDVRAHVLCDIAACHNAQGHPEEALRTVRLAGGDERTHPVVVTMLHGVRARAYAALGEREGCEREIRLLEGVAATVDPDAVPGWFAGWQPAHVGALCGHAYADLARATGDVDALAAAHAALVTAAERLVEVRPRAAALCLTHLAHAHRKCGDPDHVVGLVARAQHLAGNLRSGRVSADLAGLRSSTVGEAPQGRS